MNLLGVKQICILRIIFYALSPRLQGGAIVYLTFLTYRYFKDK